jgi:pyruvate dehydrogenase E2 component (dihydrolipoamide acetyltransferase)
MPKEFTLPELGENIETVEVSSVLVAEGDRIRKDQPVVEVETEKASLEVPAPYDATVAHVHVKAGDMVGVGQVLLSLDAVDASAAVEPEPAVAAEPPPAAEAPARPAPPPRPEAVAPVAEPPQDPVPFPAPAAASAAPAVRPRVMEFTRPDLGDPAPAAPSVRRLARELGVDVARVPGSGSGGRISIQDVKDYTKHLLSRGAPPAAAGAPARDLPDFALWGPVERKPWSAVRRATVDNMANAWSQIPHVTQFDRADVTDLEVLRKKYQPRAEAAGGKLTVTAIAIKVAAGALKVFPKFNASIDVGGEEVVLKKYVHVGVAVDTDRGLLVPVIRDVDRKNIVEIASEMTDIAERARSKKVRPDELQGACFTVTNLGGLGTTYFSPIVNWPEVAILGVGRAEVQAVHQNGEFVPRRILPLSISYDHRWIDGADAARFLRWIAEALEQPMLLALEG